MIYKSGLQNSIREIENIWIPMPDGCRLAARCAHGLLHLHHTGDKHAAGKCELGLFQLWCHQL